MSSSRKRATGTVPLGRSAIAIQVALALLISGFLITRFDVSLPFVHETYEVKALLSDAAGLDPSDRPGVVVGGVKVGRVTAVTLSRATGRAVATLQLNKDTRGKIFEDATLKIVPRSALQDLVVNIDPGTPNAGALAPDKKLDAGAGAAPIGYDRVLGVLDSDTQAYAQILLSTLHEVLRDRPGPLRDAINRLPELSPPATRLAEQLAGRRRDLTALVSEFDAIATATGRRGGQLGRVVRTARTTLEVTAAREREIAQSFRALPPTLRQADTTFAAVRELAAPVLPALSALRPTARALPGALRATRRLAAPTSALLTDAAPLLKDGRAPLAALSGAMRELGPAARELSPLLPVLRRLIEKTNENRPSILTLLTNWPGTISVTGNTGVESRTQFLAMEELKPALFGLQNPQERSRLAGAVRSLRERRPDLFTDAPRNKPGSPLLQAVRALLIDKCARYSVACTAVTQLDRQAASERGTP